MTHNIIVRINNRHIHLTKDIYEQLFDTDEPPKDYDLNQIGQYASTDTVTLLVNNKEIPNVRLVGPLRNYNQVEISKRDARHLGVVPPVRESGNLTGALPVTIKTNKGQVTIDALVIPERHVHINTSVAKEHNIHDGQLVAVLLPGQKAGLIYANVRVSDSGYFELHLDTDDANAFLLEDNQLVQIVSNF